MAASPSSQDFRPLAIDQTTFLGLVWGSTWVSFFFVLFRGYIRFRAFRRFFFDDALVLLAWICLLVAAAVWQSRVWIIYYVWNISDGTITTPPADLFELLSKQVHQGLAVTILNLVSLWSIKFAFLVLFRKMGRNVRKQKALWWTVFLFTVATFVISIGIQAYGCVFGDIRENSARCAQRSVGLYVRAILRVQAAVDVASDGLITLIPISLLWTVRIKLQTKLEIIAVFCLTAFTMIAAIVKVVVTLKGPREDDSWLFSWSAIECAVAIAISCLVSYRVALHKEPPTKKYQGGTSSYPLRYRRNFSSTKVSEDQFVTRGDRSSLHSLEEEGNLSVPKRIHVRQEYRVTEDPI